MTPVDDLYAFLLGHWRVERDYSDRSTGKRGHFVGRAEFAPSAEARCLAYEEQIETVLDDWSGTSRQHYTYTFAAPSSAIVRFRDGRYFHDLDLSSGICRVQHLCEADTYDGIFRCVSNDDWRLRWKVTGPRKHYIIESRFGRKRIRTDQS